jgi:hypothetical protein
MFLEEYCRRRLSKEIFHYGGDRSANDCRKESSFFQKAAGPDANLTLPPTYLQPKITFNADDYEQKARIKEGLVKRKGQFVLPLLKNGSTLFF